MKLHIMEAGPHTTVQDMGRVGYQEYGITASGVMDRKAYLMANKLVGNKENAAVLEATLMGPRIRIEGNGMIAFMGADMPATINEEQIQRGRAYEVKDGQILSFGMAKSGVRMYLAVAGGIDVPMVMGSRSTNLKVGLGGYQGRKLLAGDILSSFQADIPELKRRKKANVVPPVYRDICTIRVIPGPQDDVFTEDDRILFYTKEYVVTPESDRMGIRLAGPALKGKNGMDIVSDGITFGSIQVTSKGQPIILMADHQTTGGYAKIATVVTEDLPILAQARPGTKIHFQKVSIEQVQKGGGFFTRLFRKEAV